MHGAVCHPHRRSSGRGCGRHGRVWLCGQPLGGGPQGPRTARGPISQGTHRRPDRGRVPAASSDRSRGWLGRPGDAGDDRRGALVTQPRKGDIWWAEAEDKRRPVLVVTRSRAIPVLTWIVVAPITRTVRGIPTEV